MGCGAVLVTIECDGEESKGEQEGKGEQESKGEQEGKRLSAQKLIEKYYYQLTVGCGQVICVSSHSCMYPMAIC